MNLEREIIQSFSWRFYFLFWDSRISNMPCVRSTGAAEGLQERKYDL